MSEKRITGDVVHQRLRARQQTAARQLDYLGMDVADRVLELRALGDEARARTVERCACPGDESADLLYGSACTLRPCPPCGACLAMRFREEAEVALATMPLARLLRFILPSQEGETLDMTWSLARAALARVRLDLFGGLRRAFGVIYRVLNSAGPHGTIVIDLLIDIDAIAASDVAKRWGLLTCGRGTIREHLAHVRKPLSLARQLTKETNWFPPPRTTPVNDLGELWTAMRRRRLTIVWTGKRCPRPSTEAGRTRSRSKR